MCVSFTDISSSANIHWCKQLILIHCVAFILLFSPAFPQTAGIHWTYITMSTALCEHAECGLSCGRKLLPSFNLNNTPVKFQDCICNSCGDNICPDRHTNTWISPQNLWWFLKQKLSPGRHFVMMTHTLTRTDSQDENNTSRLRCRCR